jgi:molybdate-binding protein
MLKDDAHQVYRNRNYLLNVFEIHRLALLENDPVLVRYIDKPYFNPSVAVAIGHFAKEQELVVANGVFRGVDGLNDVDDARHP